MALPLVVLPLVRRTVRLLALPPTVPLPVRPLPSILGALQVLPCALAVDLARPPIAVVDRAVGPREFALAVLAVSLRRYDMSPQQEII